MDCNFGVRFPIEPQYSIALGEDVFCVANKFQSKCYVQIRKYGSTAIRYFPTGKGISMSKEEFENFMQNCENHKSELVTAHASKILFINHSLAISLMVGDDDDERKVTFLKGTDHASAKCITLTETQFERLCDSRDEILSYISHVVDSLEDS